jgi:aspartyl-tRNA(Asn)/glutamyl-tRNA(Gln) amidotransferase subunit A
MVDRHALTVRLAANLVRTREISAVELAEWTLDAVALTEPHVHAYAYIDPDAIRESARQADRQLATGVAVGPLHGVPIGLKDVVFTSDMPTRAGSRVLADDVSRFDATIVHLLREAGALITGKLVTHEFAYGQDTPPTRNAWHLDQYPGGSSAGAGVAVAVGSASRPRSTAYPASSRRSAGSATGACCRSDLRWIT